MNIADNERLKSGYQIVPYITHYTGRSGDITSTLFFKWDFILKKCLENNLFLFFCLKILFIALSSALHRSCLRKYINDIQ